MNEELKKIVAAESEALEELLNALEEQSRNVLKGSPAVMESSIQKLEDINRKVAQLEVKRREITNGSPMSTIVNSSNDEEFQESYRKIKRLIKEAQIQKNFNQNIIKQGLGFTNRMLNILNPDRAVKTYNSYGKLKR